MVDSGVLNINLNDMDIQILTGAQRQKIQPTRTAKLYFKEIDKNIIIKKFIIINLMHKVVYNK